MAKIQRIITAHSAALYAVESIPDRNLLLTGGADNIIRSWDLDTFEGTPFSIKTNSAILKLDSIPGKNELLIGLFNGDFHVVNIESKKQVKFISLHKEGLFSSYVDKHKKQLVLGSGDSAYSIWDYTNYKLLNKGQFDFGKIRNIEKVDEEYIMGTSEGALIGVDSHRFKNRVIYEFESGNGINALHYLPKNKTLLLGTKKGVITAFNVQEKKELFSIPAHSLPIYQIRSIEANKIVSCSRDKTIKIWNIKSRELIQQMNWDSHESHTHSVNNLHFIPKKNLLISVGDGKRVVIWEVKENTSS